MPIFASYSHTHGLSLDSVNPYLAYLGVSVVLNPLVIGSELTKVNVRGGDNGLTERWRSI